MPAASTNPLEWIKIWVSAITRPTPANYTRLFVEAEPQRRLALVWLMIGGFLAALISMATYRAPLQVVLITLACALPLFAAVYVAITVITARSALWMACQMRAGGSLDQMLYGLAAVNTPMSILSALAYLLPYGNLLAYALTAYWIYLTVLVIKTLTGLSWGRALLASLVFILLSLLVLALSVGLALLP
jgi:hypothetical protein